MKGYIYPFLFGALLTISSLVFAGDIPSTYINIATVIESLQSQGYHHIKEIMLDDNAYHVEALSRAGKWVSLFVDSQTNQITQVNPGNSGKAARSPQITLLMAINKVEKAGYRNIYGVNLQGNAYHIKAYDQDDKQTELTIDSATGDIKS